MAGMRWTGEMSDPSGWTRDARVTAQELASLLGVSDRTARRWKDAGLRFDDDGTVSLYRALHWRFTGAGASRLGEVPWDQQMLCFVRTARAFGLTRELWEWEVHKWVPVEDDNDDDSCSEEAELQRDYENGLTEEETEALRLWYTENGIDLETTCEFAPSEDELRERRIGELEAENARLLGEVELLKKGTTKPSGRSRAKPKAEPRAKPGTKPKD